TAPTAPTSLPADIPLRREVAGAPSGSPVLVLIALLSLAVGGGVLVLRRRGMTGLMRAWRVPKAQPAIERMGTESLTPLVSVHVLRWQGEDLLVACTSAQVVVLSRRPVPPNDAEGA